MNHEFDEGLGNSTERRSRKNPRMRAQDRASYTRQSQNPELKVFDDASVHPVKQRKVSASAKTAATAESFGRGGSGLSSRQERQIARRKKRRRMIAMIIAECFALAAIFGYGYFLRHWNQIQRPKFDETVIRNEGLSMDVQEKMKGYWTIAVFGVDARDKAIAKGTNADVNMICNINLDTGEIKLVSVFRDSYLNISTDGSYNKINQAYFLGGPEQAVAALNRNLDLNITDYMTFNWKAVADAINVLGGVDIELSKAEFYYINSFITETVKATGVGSNHLKSAGMNHLDGVQAVAYGRLRLMDTDYARTERQRKVIKQAFEKAKQSDFDTLNRVLATVFPQVATSMNINDLFTSLKMINRYHLGETTGFPQARGDASMGKKGSVVVPQTLETNVVKLHEFLFGDEAYTPSDTVKKISAKIAADTGMYKEGKYVQSVNTDGGVIQKPKETKAATKSTESSEDSESSETATSKGKYATVYVLNENGKKVKKSVLMETDEDGEYIEPETNDAGLAVDWSLDEDGDLVKRETDEYGEAVRPTTSARPTEVETDEDGNPVETHRRPGDDDNNDPSTPHGSTTDPGTNGRPTHTDPSGQNNRPGSTTEPTGAFRPGFLDETPHSSANPTTPNSPTTDTPTTNTPGSTHPGGTGNTPTEPHPGINGSGTTSAPGGNTTPTSAAGGNGPGSVGTGSGTGTAGSPGGSSSPVGQFPGSGGPGSSSQPDNNTNAILPSGGVVSAPGQ